MFLGATFRVTKIHVLTNDYKSHPLVNMEVKVGGRNEIDPLDSSSHPSPAQAFPNKGANKRLDCMEGTKVLHSRIFAIYFGGHTLVVKF